MAAPGCLDSIRRKQRSARRLISSRLASYVEVQEKNMHTLTAEEMQHLLAVAKGHRLEALLTLALTTGMRCGELLALQWKDIDWRDGSLQICRSLHFGEVSSPKSEAARRTVILPSFILDLLQAHRKRQNEERSHAGPQWTERDLVFSTSTGDFLNPQQLDTDMQTLLTQAQLPPLSFHDLRCSVGLLLFLREKGGSHNEPPADVLGK